MDIVAGGILRILTYNVRYFGHRTGGLASQDGMIRDIARTIAHLPGGAPEILCFQEIETFSLRADLHRHYRNGRLNEGRKSLSTLLHYFKSARDESSPTQLQLFSEYFSNELQNAGNFSDYSSHYFPAHTYRLRKEHNLYTTGLAILVKKPLRVLEHNADLPQDITHRRLKRLARWKQTRICAHARIALSDGELLDIFNTHLSLPAFLSRSMFNYTSKLGHGNNQLMEVRELLKFIGRTRHPSAAMALVGDFNSLPGSPVHLALTRDCGLYDPLNHIRGHSLGLNALYPTAGVMGLYLPIDYMFCCDKLRWRRFENTKQFGDSEGPFHGLSDHVPLLGQFEI